MTLYGLVKKRYVIDGSGAPWFKASRGASNGGMEETGKSTSEKADRVIDVK